MIIGVGVDIVDVDRFAATLERTPGVRTRLFTEPERERDTRSLAARFAAKEAVAKALGAPAGMQWVEVEIGSAPSGAPFIQTSGTVARTAHELGIQGWHVSLSHDGGMAVAMVIAQS